MTTTTKPSKAVKLPPTEVYADLDELIYGRPERPGVRRNPLAGRRIA